MKFKDLVTKKKSELVEVADFNSASQMKKSKLIEKLADDICKEYKELLELNANEVKRTAEEYGVEYTTKKETLAKISEKVSDESESEESNKESSWYDEFRKAIDLAVRRTLSEGRSYKVLSTEEENIFNVSPTYIQHDESKDLLLTINIFEKAKHNE